MAASKIAKEAGLETLKQAIDYLSIPRRNLERLCKRDPLHFECLMIGVAAKLSK